MDFGKYYPYIFISLALFGIVYDQVVSWLERTGRSRGGVSLLVAVGTGITLAAGIPEFGLELVVKMLGFFVAAGTPMIIGSLARYSRERDEKEKKAAEIAKGLLEERYHDDAEAADR